MAHEIEDNRMIYVGDKPWHDKGTALTEVLNASEGIKLFYPESIASLPISAKIQLDDSDPSYLDISHDQYQAIVRSDGKILHVAKGRYEIVQPSELASLIDPFIDTGLATLETGMSLFDGKKLVISLKVKDSLREVIKGDVIKTYLLAYMGLDGSLGIGIKSPNERVVCANTLERARNEECKTDFSFKHTKNVRVSLERARDTILSTLNQFDKDIESYKYLASKKCNDDQLSDYVREVFNAVESDNKDISTKTENKIQHVIELTLNQPEREMIPVMAGTYWNAYNGVTRYLSHDYGRNADNRFDSIMFGQSANVSKRALDIALNA